MDIEAHLNRNELRRFAAEARAYDRLGRQIDAAEALVGELCREGRKVFYINVRSKAGKITGKTREFASLALARQFLIRNSYV